MIQAARLLRTWLAYGTIRAASFSEMRCAGGWRWREGLGWTGLFRESAAGARGWARRFAKLGSCRVCRRGEGLGAYGLRSWVRAGCAAGARVWARMVREGRFLLGMPPGRGPGRVWFAKLGSCRVCRRDDGLGAYGSRSWVPAGCAAGATVWARMVREVGFVPSVLPRVARA